LFGWEAIGDLDIDGDRKPDLVVGAERDGTRLPNQPWPGGIYAYSNQGRLLYHLVDLPNLNYLGYRLARVGDVDSDGCDDFAASALEPTQGVVLLFSGKTGKLILKAYGELDGVIGRTLTGCGDIDGDGIPDFASGTAPSLGERGMVRAWSGRTGKTVHTWYAKSQKQYANGFGWVLGIDDADLDGVPDLLIANDEPDQASSGAWVVATYSGRDGTRLLRHRVTEVSGGEIATGGAQAGSSPFPVYVLLTQNLKGCERGCTDVGRITMYRAVPSGVQQFGLACRGTLPTEPRIGIRSVEPASTRIHLSGGEPGGTGVFVAGLSRTSWLGWPLPFPLAPFGFPNCSLFTSVEVAIPIPLGTGGLSAGYGAVDIPLALTATGTALHGQWLVLRAQTNTPGGASDVMRWRH
jgi:hypothetical protein